MTAGWRTSLLLNPEASSFWREIENSALWPHHLIRVAPEQKAIYVMVPKVASTRIRDTLGQVIGKRSRRLKPKYYGRIREAPGPRAIGAAKFFALVKDPQTFRFSFVRNPYSRLVGVWANGLKDCPLVPGLSGAVDRYLRVRQTIGGNLPAGADKTLTFPSFVDYAEQRLQVGPEQHLVSQDTLLSVPGIDLDFVGRLENFDADFAYVLKRLGASDEIRVDASKPINKSNHGPWQDYYTPEVVRRVQKLYERDFDRFRYPMTIPR
jgi:hypothetical protein